jgi:hypothetical protein
MLETTVKEISTVKIPSLAIEDNGAVRMGSFTPPFPSVDALPTSLVHNGKVQMGSYSPMFPPVPAK